VRAAEVEENIERVEELSELSPNMCILAPPRVRGFDLKTKEWCKSLVLVSVCCIQMAEGVNTRQACSMLTTSRTPSGMRHPTRNSYCLAAKRRRSLSWRSPSTEPTIKVSTTLSARRVYPPFYFLPLRSK